MGYVTDEDFDRIFEMGKESERKKQRRAKNRVLERQDRVDFWFIFLLSIASAIIILIELLEVAHRFGMLY